MNRISSVFNLNHLFQLISVVTFKHFFTSQASTMAIDKQEKFVINLVGDVMIG
jgi:hypothetical protein